MIYSLILYIKKSLYNFPFWCKAVFTYTCNWILSCSTILVFLYFVNNILFICDIHVLWNHHFSWGTNVRSFVGNPCPRVYITANIYKHLFNVYWNYTGIGTNEIASPRNRNLLGTHKHWTPRMQLIPQYMLTLD